MDSFYTYISRKLLLVSLIGTIFIIYPNIACLPFDFIHLDSSRYPGLLSFFTFRLLYFWILIWLITRYNLQKMSSTLFLKRLTRNFWLWFVAYIVYTPISYLVSSHGIHGDYLASIVIFQFFVACFFCTFIGYISMLYTHQREKDLEIEELRIENLQSRCDALTNQINPHFFFNSLNGLSSLIRKKNDEKTLTYVNKLSDVFRYILQSDKKGLVTLEEELEFVHAFRYMMEVRFANKLEFRVEVDSKMLSYKLPVLSILPLIDNVVVHNMIDSEHKMVVDIRLNGQKELVISNPVYPKLSPPDTNGTGLKNLCNRFSLLMNNQIRIENTGEMFFVYLPLI